jgi:hypothetical protein
VSNVHHQEIHQVLDVQMSDDEFVEEMHNGLMNLIGTADQMDFHIDWSTLRIREPETISVSNAAGEETQVYSMGMMLIVDSIKIVEDEE